MSNYAATIDLPDHKLGDRFIGITVGPVTINDETPDQPLERVRMHFSNLGRVFRFDSDASTNPDAAITIADAATWEVSVPSVEEFVPAPGEWDWDMEFHDAAGGYGPITLYRGTLTVHPDITR